MIPKIIHYCWFGRNKKTELIQRCINSWKKFCPDYDVVEWNEDNFDYQSCQYAAEAYQTKNWAFVSDYARFKVLNEYGGIYLDVDVELLRSISDIVDKGPFIGEEYSQSGKFAINPGLIMAAEKQMPFLQMILDDYERDCFIGAKKKKTVVNRVTDLMKEYGFQGKDETEYVLGMYLYPPEFFCPINYYTGETNIAENTLSIHHYNGSWVNKWDKIFIKIQRAKNTNSGLRKKLLILLFLPVEFIIMLHNKGLKNTLKYCVNYIFH